MKNFKFACLFVLSVFFTNILSAQILDSRASKISEIEERFEQYVNDTIDDFQIDKKIISNLKNHPEYKFSGSQNEINELKKIFLRKIFFEKSKSGFEISSYNKDFNVPFCENGGFEDDLNIGNYNFASMKYSPLSGPELENILGQGWSLCNNYIHLNLSNSSPIYSSYFNINGFNNGKISIVNPGLDPIIPNLQMVYSGNRSIKLNNSTPTGSVINHNANAYGHVSEVTKRFVIDREILNFKYSLVVQHPLHANVPIHDAQNEDQPSFVYRVVTFDSNGEEIEIDKVCIGADLSNPIFNEYDLNGNLYLFTNWVCARLNVAEYIGKDAEIQFIMSDCGKGAHYGYVYIDDICVPCERGGVIDIDIPQEEIKCPDFPRKIGGTVNGLGQGLSIASINLLILNSNGNITTIPVTDINGSDFSYFLQPSDLGYPILEGVVYSGIIEVTLSDGTIIRKEFLKIIFENCCYPTPGGPSKNIECERVQNKSNGSNNIEFKKGIVTNPNVMIVSPNPNNGEFMLNFNNEVSGNIEIYDELGKLIKVEKVVKITKYTVNLGVVKQGVYLIKFKNKKEIMTKKIIIK